MLLCLVFVDRNLVCLTPIEMMSEMYKIIFIDTRHILSNYIFIWCHITNLPEIKLKIYGNQMVYVIQCWCSCWCTRTSNQTIITANTVRCTSVWIMWDENKINWLNFFVFGLCSSVAELTKPSTNQLAEWPSWIWLQMCLVLLLCNIKKQTKNARTNEYG